jgi:hypothetical protein
MKQEALDRNRRRIIPRFGIGALLALTVCVASYMAGRKHGFDDARDMWIGCLPRMTCVYNVHDLVSTTSAQESGTSAAELCELLKSEIRLSGLSTTRSDVMADPGREAGTICITANELAHKKTAEILVRCRATRDK